MVLSSSHLANPLLTLNRKPPIEIVHLYVSPAHNYFGHHGHPADAHAILEVSEARCVAGRGIEGDRFFDFKESYKGQITFFSWEVYEALRKELKVEGCSPSVFRRNAITLGVDLNELIGQTFEIQGVRFEGVEECRPCYWMDEAFHAGAEERMRGRGGLRARILTSGTLWQSTHFPPVTACLIAGGKSSRMGSDKAGVEFEGTVLWKRQMAALEALSPVESLISGRAGAAYAESGLLIVEDEVSDAGPLAGIVSGLRAAAQPLVCFLAVDLPWICGNDLVSLLVACSETCGAVPAHDGYFEALAAIFPKTALPLAEMALQSEDRSLQHFVRECEARGLVRVIESANGNEARFKSVNSPEDLNAQ